MLRPMVATAAVTAAVVLLAGCGGDKKSDAKSDGDSGNSSGQSTPTAPSVPSFDPPKAFTAAAAFPKQRDRTATVGIDNTVVGIAGQTGLLGDLTGLTGFDMAGKNGPWNVASKSADTTTVVASSTPMAVKLDGKDAVAVAYVEDDKGNGTQKAKGIVVFQWIDPADGKKLAEVTTDLSATLGPGEGGQRISTQAYDEETGQIAIGVAADSAAGATKVGRLFTVYADPKTQKSTIIPFIAPAGVLDGKIVGAKGDNEEHAANGTIVQADAATGKILKQTPLRTDYLSVIGTGPKQGYLASTTYTSTKKTSIGIPIGNYNNTLYSVDIATGAVVTTKSALSPEDDAAYRCWSDRAAATVCIGDEGDGSKEILGFDDTTGKKAWGYTDKSANRIIPDVTAAYHGVVYAQTEAQPVLMDAKTGQDIPTASPTPSDSGTPGSSDTPSSGDTPSSSDSPSAGDTPSESGANGSDMSLWDGKPLSPEAVSPYGAVYKQAGRADDYDIEMVLIMLKATA